MKKESERELKKRKTREEERSENNELNIERKKRKIRRRQRKDQCKWNEERREEVKRWYICIMIVEEEV